jgi:heme/copper-type cytochrome/quinol oxidase subunit 3
MNTVLNERTSAAYQAEQKKKVGLIGVVFFILAESMFFLGLFLAWFYLRSTNEIWPPAGVAHPPIAPALFNTLLALCSAVCMVVADRGAAHGNQRQLIGGVIASAAFGVVFMAVQATEFANLSLLAQDSAFGSTFTFLLFFHVVRVFVGVVLMTVVLIRALLGQINPRHRLLVQATALYWYFITGVWLVVFTVLYLAK